MRPRAVWLLLELQTAQIGSDLGTSHWRILNCLKLFRTSASASSLSSQRACSLSDPPKEHPKPEGITSTMRSGTCVLCCPSARKTRSACPTCTPWQQPAPTSGSLFSSKVSPHSPFLDHVLKRSMAAAQGGTFRWQLPVRL